MAEVKYAIVNFQPTANQAAKGMGHSVYAVNVIDNVINNQELAKKIENRGISRQSEIKMILEEAAKVILEEVGENNRVQLSTGEGVMVSIEPSVEGRLSDKDVVANPDKYDGATAATPDMLTADMLTWSLKATVGTKFSKEFALRKTARRVKTAAVGDNASEQEGNGSENENGENGGNGGTTPPENGGGENEE